MFNKLKITLSFIIIITLILTCTSCKNANPSNKDSELSVYFLDVEDGNSTLIITPSNKTILLDAGSKATSKGLVERIKSYGVSTIDYFILSHFDENHIGGTEAVLENFNVVCAYLPYIEENKLNIFPDYKIHYENVKSKIGEQNIKTNKVLQNIKEDDFFFLFLSPEEPMNTQSEYKNLYSTVSPSEEQVDAISAVVYFSYKDTRFIVCNDAGENQEKEILRKHQLGYYSKFFSNNPEIKLEGVDFLVLSREGGEGANSLEFLEKLKPKNAIISVSGKNSNENPKLSVLIRLQEASPLCRLYQTNVCGDIGVFVQEDGTYKTYKQNEI